MLHETPPAILERARLGIENSLRDQAHARVDPAAAAARGSAMRVLSVADRHLGFETCRTEMIAMARRTMAPFEALELSARICGVPNPYDVEVIKAAREGRTS